MNCPKCNNQNITIEKSLIELDFRGEKYNVFDFYYKCKKCQVEFSDDYLDNLTIDQVYNSYREKHKIPFPEQLNRIKNEYGLSARKMSEVLGLGQNSFNNYENGEVPSLANANLLKQSALNPENFKILLLDKRDEIRWITNEIINRIYKYIDKKENNYVTDCFCKIIFGSIDPNEYNGYKQPNIDKLGNVVAYFVENQVPYKTKLNKLLFYSDFLHFKKYGKSISGTTYAAIPYGPVPSNYESLFEFLVSHEIVNVKITIDGDSELSQYLPSNKKINYKLFSNEELETLNKVNDYFKNFTGKEIVKISHKESAWKENEKKRSAISYQKYGFDLKAV